MKRIFYLMLLLLIAACQNKKESFKISRDWGAMAQAVMESKEMKHIANPAMTIIKTDNAKTIGILDFTTQYVKDVQYIPLKKTGTPIGEIDYILVYKNRIFVLDTFQTKSVYIFDMQGNYIGQAGRVGQGPGEYTQPFAISIDENNETPLLVVTDNILYMHYYTLDGKFVKSEVRFIGSFSIKHKGVGFNASCIGSLGKRLEEEYDLIVSYGDTVQYKGFKAYPLQKEAAGGQYLLRVNNDNLFFTPKLSDTTYTILSDSTYTPHIVIQHPKTVWKASFLDKATDAGKFVGENYLEYLREPVCETADAISFKLVSRAKNGDRKLVFDFFFYLKATQEVIRVSSEPEYNPNRSLNFMPPVISLWAHNVYGDYFIEELRPEVLEALRSSEIPEGMTVDEQLRAIIEDKTIDQGIVLYKL